MEKLVGPEMGYDELYNSNKTDYEENAFADDETSSESDEGGNSDID